MDQGFNNPAFNLSQFGPRQDLSNQMTQQKKKKPWWTSIISELGGTGGALGGAAVGATAGSVVPVLGTAIGGLIGAGVGGLAGAFTGRVAENKIRDDRLGLGDAAKEGLITGLLAPGPLKLAKGAGMAVKAAATGGKLLPAFEKGATTSLMKTATSKVANAGEDIAARTFARAFTVPSKLAARLKPVETSKELISHGVGGSLTNMADTAAKVTGENGILTRTTREAVARIPGDIKVDDFMPTVRNALTQGSMIESGQEKKILQAIFKMDKPGILPNSMNPLDALDNVKGLEKIGYQFMNSSTKLSPNVANEQIGKVYLDAADAIKDSLEKAIGNKNILEGLKTPEMFMQLQQVSPKLAKQFSEAKTMADLRHIQAPFVRLGQMIGLTEDAAQSVGGGMATSLGSRGAGGALGFAAGGPIGAGIGIAAAPFVEGLEQAARAPLTTKGGSLLAKMGGAGAPKDFNLSKLGIGARTTVPPAIGAMGAQSQEQNGEVYPNETPWLPDGTSGPLLQGGQDDLLGLGGQMGGSQEGSDFLGLGQSGGLSMESLQEALKQDYIATGGKNSEFLMQLAQLNGIGTEPQEITANQEKTLMGTDTASSIVDQVEQELNTLGASGRIGGTASKLAGRVGLNDAVSAYESGRPSTALMLIKAIQGSAGNISDADRTAIEASIPSVTDTGGERKNKLNRLRSIIGAYRSSASRSYGSVSQDLLSQTNGQ